MMGSQSQQREWGLAGAGATPRCRSHLIVRHGVLRYVYQTGNGRGHHCAPDGCRWNWCSLRSIGARHTGCG